MKKIGLVIGKKELPLIPMRELVVFPHMIVPFYVGRKGSISAIEKAMKEDRIIFLSCQKKQTENPAEEDIHNTGTVSKIMQMLKLPDGTIRILAEGLERGIIQRFIKQKNSSLTVQIKPIRENREITPAVSALMGAIQNSFKRYTQFKKKIPPEIIAAVEKAEYPDKLIDIACANSSLKLEKKIEILQKTEISDRLEELAISLETENEVLKLQNKITVKVKKKLEKNQKEYFLNEQLKQINKELGKDEDDPSGANELLAIIQSKNPPEEVLEKAEKESKRLLKLQPMSPESGVLRTYLEWISDLPWNTVNTENYSIDEAEKILNEDHYDMKKPKERILDFIAVRQLKEKLKGPILCFIGPPGTGKTSLGKSVARALNRKFVRISLGGVRDEAEIRGHRKTYVGALPGKIIQSMKKAESTNPVFLLDEIDKINSDFRGDPASALLEVLDPEQNSHFVDHYLEVPYDLSGVMFITTANSIHSIPHALRDRMEIIEIPGYTDLEKEKIAADFIIPKQIEENGLIWADIRFQKNAVLEIIQGYTMESGVRNLEREIAGVIRKIAREAVKQGYNREKKSPFKTVVTARGIKKYLGAKKFEGDLVYKDPRRGLAHGLAWTEMGGTLLPVEAEVLDGSGELILTGNLGDVMKESARTALSFLRAHYKLWNLPKDFYKVYDIHVHVPEGAIPKDGPSAGITLTAAILSALSGIKINNGYSMTGEITLTGRILPIGGVKEKVLAAYRNKMKKVLMPEGNRKDTEELPREVLQSIDFIFFDSTLNAISALFPDELEKLPKKKPNRS